MHCKKVSGVFSCIFGFGFKKLRVFGENEEFQRLGCSLAKNLDL